MSNIVTAFSKAEMNGGNFISSHLLSLYEAIVVDPDIPGLNIEDYKPKLLLTNSLNVASSVNCPIFIYINQEDGVDNWQRNVNQNLWRQACVGLQKAQHIAAASRYCAHEISKIFRVNCSIHYPYLPVLSCSSGRNIGFHGRLPIDEFRQEFPGESFSSVEKYSDLNDVKLFIYLPDDTVSNTLWLGMAAMRGIPTITIGDGCLSEMASPGDSILPADANNQQWLYTIRVALRDLELNSREALKHSTRYNHMSELEGKIKQALNTAFNTQEKRSFVAIQQIADKKHNTMPKLLSKKVERNSQKRPNIITSLRVEYSQAIRFLDQFNNVMVGVGGIGDAWLTLAAAARSKCNGVIYAANGGVDGVIKTIFELWDIPVLTIPNLNGSFEGLNVYLQLTRHPNCRGTVHIPDRLNYSEWKTNTVKYLQRITPKLPSSVEKFGKLDNPRETRGIVGIAPRGSDHNNYGRQRFLSVAEYNTIVGNYLKEGYTVFVFGSRIDCEHYGVFADNNVIWFGSDFAVSYPFPDYPITMSHMLSAINACNKIVSVDSWVKTYSGLVGIPTQVILTRCNGRADRSWHDPSDSIFLNSSLWKFELVDITQALKKVEVVLP